jgi:hypothetical protein
MSSRFHALCVDADTTPLGREASRPEPTHRAVRAPDIGGR